LAMPPVQKPDKVPHSAVWADGTFIFLRDPDKAQMRAR
jgi:hypothetical protein